MFPNDFDYNAKVTLESGAANLLAEEQPFRILFLGNWSGKREEETGISGFSENQLLEVDRDNFDEVLNKLNTKLNLNLAGDADSILSLNFSSLDDFHPDSLFQRVPLFSNLSDLRQRLLNPKTYDHAALEIHSWFQTTTDVTKQPVQTSDSTSESKSLSDDWLDQILSQTEEKSLSDKSNQSSELSNFVKKIVKPHLIQVDAAKQSETLMLIDEIISDLMRKILHHPEFQSLEAAWRAGFFLVRLVETNS